MYGEGISKLGEIVDLGVKANIVEKAGSWFSYNSQRIGQGKENAKQFLRDNPKMADEIEAKIRQVLGENNAPLNVAPQPKELEEAS